MIFGKHINRYYLRYAPMLIFGLVSLVAVDYLDLPHLILAHLILLEYMTMP